MDGRSLRIDLDWTRFFPIIILIGWVRFGSGHPIIDMAVDDAKNLIYTLTNNNSIEVRLLLPFAVKPLLTQCFLYFPKVWWLGPLGQDFTRVTIFENIAEEAVKLAPGLVSVDKAISTTIVNIYVISPQQTDSPLRLLGVTKGGLRLYFAVSVDTKIGQMHGSLTLQHVRFAPGQREAMGGLPGNSTFVAHSTFFNNGVMIFASPKEQVRNNQ